MINFVNILDLLFLYQWQSICHNMLIKNYNFKLNNFLDSIFVKLIKAFT